MIETGNDTFFAPLEVVENVTAAQMENEETSNFWVEVKITDGGDMVIQETDWDDVEDSQDDYIRMMVEDDYISESEAEDLGVSLED